MKATLVLADAACAHPDGTFSLLRGGITEVHVPRGRPATFKGALAVRVVGTAGEAGETHEFKLRCTDEDGHPVAPELTGTFKIPPSGGASQTVISHEIIFPKLGRYVFSVMIDRVEMDSWPLVAREAPTPTQG